MSVAYSIILPAYNEERNIKKAIMETKKVFDRFGEPFEILVVDDGSHDRTTKIARLLMDQVPELRLIRQGRNQGKGAAVKRGVIEAEGEWMLFLDCDLATHPSDFKKMRPHLSTHEVLIGSRRMKGAQIKVNQPLYRILAGRMFNLFVRVFLGLPFRDTQCGFKAFHQKTRPLFAGLKSGGWVFDVELLLKAKKRGFRLKEVPVTWRNGRDSRVRLKDAFRILEELWALRHLS